MTGTAAQHETETEMKTTYRLGRKETGSTQAWTFLARDTNVDLLWYEADFDNDMHPGRFEYTIVADGMPW